MRGTDSSQMHKSILSSNTFTAKVNKSDFRHDAMKEIRRVESLQLEFVCHPRQGGEEITPRGLYLFNRTQGFNVHEFSPAATLWLS